VTRRITPRQRAVIDKMRELDRAIRPIDVVSTARNSPLPRTESTARGILAALERKRVLRRFGTPARWTFEESLPSV
jgi:hypothetical protein